MNYFARSQSIELSFANAFSVSFQGGESPRDNSSLASIFPSLLTVDGPKGPTSASVAAELSHALSTALSLSDNKDFASDNLDSGKQQVLEEPSESLEGKVLNNVEGETLSKSNRKSNTDINKLLQQHYCSHKNKKKHPVPSAGAIR